MADRLVITQVDVKGWRRRLAEIEQERANLLRKIEAYEVLAAPQKRRGRAKADKPAAPKQKPESASSVGISADGLNMTDTIANIASSSSAPISKNELKKQLSARGFSEKQLGPYFYTVIMRLKKHKRIVVQDDGKVWRSAA